MDILLHLMRLTLRNFVKNKFYSITIIAGFSIAIAICYLIVGLLVHENSIDGFHTRKDTIYRVLMKDPITYGTSYTTYHELYEKLQTDYPEVKLVSHVTYQGWHTIKAGKNKFQEKRLLYADTNFFKLFDYEVLLGNRASALSDPHAVVLTQATAGKYFGTQDAVGQTIQVDDQPYTVTAIAADVAGTSHLQFDMLLPAAVLPEAVNPLQGAGFTYIVLTSPGDANALTDKLNANVESVLSWKFATPQTSVFQLQSLKDCYFSDVQYGESSVLLSQDRTFLSRSGLAILIIVFITTFNFVNFSQARALFRSKEIVVLSIFGTGRGIVMLQFVIEAALLCAIAFVISLILILSTLSFFNDITGIALDLQFLFSPALLGMIGGMVLLMSVVLGFITYFLFAQVHDDKLLKSTVTLKPAYLKVLNGLIMIQICTSITLMLLNTAIWKQMNFISKQTVGSVTESILEINLLDLPPGVNPTVIKTDLQKNPEVIGASVCMGIPLEGRATHGMEADGKKMDLNLIIGDLDYVKTMGYEIAKGRDFMTLADTSYMLLNETAMKIYGMNDNFESEDQYAPKNVIGVVKDFHFESLREQIEPVNITLVNPREVSAWGASKLLVRTYGDSDDILRKLRTQWAALFPDVAFDYSILKEKYHAIYAKDQGHATLLMVGSIASTIITLVGLIGVSLYTTHRRSKEIAIRKVYGASSNTILLSFIRQITTWTLISAVAAVPVAMYFIEEWMSGFVYRTTVAWQDYLKVIAGAVLLITLAILYQVTLSSYKNPAKVLRND
ncbi:ABC transporter permease [Dawidia soli]|uniref:ABC transporter permease n=1 Tax=Dawidia soli TaxID=2782352 RepID=A0AAP2DCW2_9BACT|nr:ABC transporter permease [Dawidia soli]MBT1689836.1 ABC transporter permease [Dawidia soli]